STKTIEKGVRFPAEDRFRAEAGRRPELPRRPNPVSLPGQEQGEMEADGLAARETGGQRAEPTERADGVVLVVEAHRGGHLGLVVAGPQAGGPRPDALGRALVAGGLEAGPAHEEGVARDGLEGRVAREELRVEERVGELLRPGVAAEALRLPQRRLRVGAVPRRDEREPVVEGHGGIA